MNWPAQGVYFFFESGECRSDSGTGLRVVRVGTHAISRGSKSSLWQRLSQHRGSVSTGLGNHRGSIFRLLVGDALCAAGTTAVSPHWGNKKSTSDLGLSRQEVLESERDIESKVSLHIGQMPFLWIDVGGISAPDNDRGCLERNAIALLSNYQRPAFDQSSPNWLGRHSHRQRVRDSGLWNNREVDKHHDPTFLLKLENYISLTQPRTSGKLAVTVRSQPIPDNAEPRAITISPPVPPDLLSRLVAHFSPRRIILFGSHATGHAHAESDLDLLVILDDDAPPNRLTLRAGWEARRGYDHAVDIIPVRESVFRRRARIPGSLAHAAETEGIAVYERP